MTVNKLLEEMRRFFPDTFTSQFEETWLPVFFVTLQEFEGPRLERAWRALLTSWKFKRAPTPADLKELCEATHAGSTGRLYGDVDDETLLREIAFWRNVEETKGIGGYGLSKFEAEAAHRGLLTPRSSTTNGLTE